MHDSSGLLAAKDGLQAVRTPRNAELCRPSVIEVAARAATSPACGADMNDSFRLQGKGNLTGQWTLRTHVRPELDVLRTAHMHELGRDLDSFRE